MRERLGTLCDDFIASGQYKEIYDTLSIVEGLDKHMRKLTSKNWTWSSGMTQVPESTLSKTMRTVIRSLEDLLLNAMEGASVSDLMHKGLLLFQVVPDVVLG